MYDHLLHYNTTNRLQADLRSTMRAYNFDKEKLSHNLSGLHSTDRMSIASSMDLSSNTSVTLTPRKFYRAPNLAACSNSSSGSFKSNLTDKKWKDRKEHSDKMKKEMDMLKLPVIHSASSKRSEWESGKFLQPTSDKQRPFSGLEPLPGINAARALLADSMKIPSIYDPQRMDTAIDTNKYKKSVKKVTFADETDGPLLFVSQIDSTRFEAKHKSKNLKEKGSVQRLNLKSNQFSPMTKPKRPQRTSILPPLQISPREERNKTHEITEWKSIFSTIVNHEQKTKALADIFNVLRLKMYENEQAMRYGNTPRSQEKDEIIKEYSSINVIKRVAYRDENGHKRRGLVPTPRSNSVSRLSNGHPNTAELQKYLQQMSRTRRSMEQIQDQHVAQHTLHQTATPISVKA